MNIESTKFRKPVFPGDKIQSDVKSIRSKGRVWRFKGKIVNKNQELMKLLGSRFIAHPPNMTIKVKINDKSHPITKGLEDFEIFDEPYYCEFSDGIKILLESRYTDDADAYVNSSWKEDIPRPQMYLHKVGKGDVLYLMLGHCRGKYDMRPFMDECPVDRGGWESEAFYELLRRGISWGINKI